MAKVPKVEPVGDRGPAMVRITSKIDGFRRAGRAHSATPTTVPASDFTDTELDALRGEPMLTVEDVYE
jgi:hypothetical protein